MPRLLYVVNIPRFFVSHRLPLALAAREAGYEAHVATAADDAANVERIRATGLPFHPLPLAQHGTHPLAEARTLGAIYQLYRTLRPDIVHHVSIKPVIYGGLAARLAGVPAVVGAVSGLGYVFTAAGFQPRLLRRLIGPLYRLALAYPPTRLIFQNPDDRDRFVRLGLIDPARAVLIRGSGVDVSVFTPQPEPDGPPVILFAGRLLWEKGVGTFVEAARRLGETARFVVVGYPEPSSPDAVPLDQLTAWAGERLIEWWGRREDMPAVFAQSHVVVLPSTYGEGVPKVLIEAAACGRAIVTTDAPGCREIARHGENGLLVPPGDLDALVGAIRTLAGDADLRRRLGERGRAIAVAEFSLDRVVRETLAVYEELLGK